MDTTEQRFLYYYTKKCLTFGNIATSRVEAGHRLLKRDLEVLSKDLLKSVLLFERTILGLYYKVKSMIIKD